MASVRVTVSLPEEVVGEIDRCERNRSRFVLRAVEQELERRRQEELRRSLDNPHAQSEEIAESGFEEWADQTTGGDQSLLETSAATEIRWETGRGWVEVGE